MSVRCIKNAGSNGLLPELETQTVQNVTQTTALLTGEVLSEGGSAVIARGFCWNTTGNPGITDSLLFAGSGPGTYSSNLSGLTHNSLYYVKAFASNSSGTAYGPEIGFITMQYTLPELNTQPVGPVGSLTVTIGGDVISEGNSAVTARGVCWNSSGNPGISDSFLIMGSGQGPFSGDISSLLPNLTYYCKHTGTGILRGMMGRPSFAGNFPGHENKEPGLSQVTYVRAH